jgi:hypothetical protein
MNCWQRRLTQWKQGQEQHLDPRWTSTTRITGDGLTALIEINLHTQNLIMSLEMTLMTRGRIARHFRARPTSFLS